MTRDNDRNDGPPTFQSDRGRAAQSDQPASWTPGPAPAPATELVPDPGGPPSPSAPGNSGFAGPSDAVTAPTVMQTGIPHANATGSAATSEGGIPRLILVGIGLVVIMAVSAVLLSIGGTRSTTTAAGIPAPAQSSGGTIAAPPTTAADTEPVFASDDPQPTVVAETVEVLPRPTASPIPVPTREPEDAVPASTGNTGDASDDSPERLTIPGTDISVPPITLEQEIELGREYVADVLEEYEIADNEAAQRILDELLARLAPSDGRDYTVTLLAADEINAFAIGGGSIFFTTGIVSIMNPDQLAFVMAHEIAHITSRHQVQQLEREALFVAAGEALFDIELPEDWFRVGDGAFINALISPTFSRDDEAEADIVALELMREADMGTASAPAALKLLQSIEPAGSDGFDIFATHPPTANRIQDVEADINENG